ncbi:PrsW family glutamic-type intramembrane protease [Micromonospora sp. NPDC051296]|uniref:PrsW family intramembrane metalloprotease n=1 Tax=Micromonospora sp. NPDC051296 TaxID=3155046 RepID=UPI003447F233
MATVGRRWAWLVVLLVGIALYLLVLLALVTTRNVIFLLLLIVLGASIAPAAFLTFAQARSGGWRVPGSIVTVAAVFGGVIGVAAAGWLEYDTLRRLGVLPIVYVGLIEEAAKLVVPAVILLLWRRRPRSPSDGLVIGVASGAGFAALETMGYALRALVTSKGSLGAVEEVLLFRGLTAPAAHLSWTGVTAAALFALAAAPSARRWLLFVVTYLGAVILHVCWDAVNAPLAYVVIGVVSLGWVLLELHHYRAWAPRSTATGGPVTGPRGDVTP